MPSVRLNAIRCNNRDAIEMFMSNSNFITLLIGPTLLFPPFLTGSFTMNYYNSYSLIKHHSLRPLISCGLPEWLRKFACDCANINCFGYCRSSNSVTEASRITRRIRLNQPSVSEADPRFDPRLYFHPTTISRSAWISIHFSTVT